MTHWAQDAIFYHIYPLGLCGAPQRNPFSGPPVDRLDVLYNWLDPIAELGANALYLGPLFESTSHGYDTSDYYHVDRRLGSRASLARLTEALRRRGMRVILDGVFNHVGRDFWAFRDLLANGRRSRYTDWFHGLDFSRRSPYHDPFWYEGWNGHFSLVKLNLANPDVREHLFLAVSQWVEDYQVDGLRLDAADVIDHGFLRALAGHCRGLRSDFWLVGEVVHGDYRSWVNPGELDSVTNYELYKGLYSSHNDRNFFEVAYSLQRQFGPGGIYRGLTLYNFCDNHDVNRIASTLSDPADLYPLHALLFTAPGVPSIYYGSEFGLPGVKNGGDHPLRPALDLAELAARAPHPDLPAAIRRLADLRKRLPALRCGDYQQEQVAPQALAFTRRWGDDWVWVAVNAGKGPLELPVRLPHPGIARLVDALNGGPALETGRGPFTWQVPAGWASVLVPA